MQLILYVGRTMTMTVRIYLSVLDGEFGTASALSTILLAVTGLAVFVVFRISERRGHRALPIIRADPCSGGLHVQPGTLDH
jgi:ABC-type Fe3+ transport system permease subunit